MTALPRLDAEVVHQGPDRELLEARCGLCRQERCAPVATVSRPGRDVHGDAVVGLACVPVAVDQATGQYPATVWCPAWSSEDLARDAGIKTARRVDHWVRLGLLSPIDSPRPGVSSVHAFLACEVEHARWLARCSAAGLNLHRAHELLVGSDEDRGMAQALWRRFRDRTEVAA